MSPTRLIHFSRIPISTHTQKNVAKHNQKRSTMSALLLDDVFELLTLATHLEETKESRVEAVTKVCASERLHVGVVRSADGNLLTWNARLNS
jgi:hypothetical protein